MYILIGILAILGLLVIHELGHYVAARALGIRVESVNIGIGPRLVEFYVKTGVYNQWHAGTFSLRLNVPFTQRRWVRWGTVLLAAESDASRWWKRAIIWLAPTVHSLTGDGILWVIRPILFAGFVKVPDLRDESVTLQRLGARALMCLAGPVTNIVAGILLIMFATTVVGITNSPAPHPYLAPYVTMTDVRTVIWGILPTGQT